MASPSSRPAHFGFGAPLAEQVLLLEHGEERGWGAPELLPRRAADLPIASAAVQYGLSCFEGLKALRGPDGSVHLFRADRHGARMVQSCERLCLPAVTPAAFVEHMQAFVRANERLVPAHGKGALYLRPTIAACEEYLGVRPAKQHVFALVGTPVPKPANKPLQLWIEREFVRAAPGGVGAAKTGGNYAAGLLGSERAKQRGLDQVIWLDAIERRYLAEAGVMNLFVVLGDEVVTPPLDGTILAGVTRECCLTLLRAFGIPVSERRVGIDELVAAWRRGDLREAFGTGTAACVVPITKMVGADEELEPAPGPIAARLREAIEAVQEGRAADRHGWRIAVTEVAVRGGRVSAGSGGAQ
jgi:branched-chain amino acid aminotransferase